MNVFIDNVQAHTLFCLCVNEVIMTKKCFKTNVMHYSGSVFDQLVLFTVASSGWIFDWKIEFLDIILVQNLLTVLT